MSKFKTTIAGVGKNTTTPTSELEKIPGPSVGLVEALVSDDPTFNGFPEPFIPTNNNNNNNEG